MPPIVRFTSETIQRLRFHRADCADLNGDCSQQAHKSKTLPVQPTGHKGLRIASFAARNSVCYHNSPSCIMLLVEFEATPFAACYRHAVAPRNWTAAIVQWRKIIERFEFEGFFY